MIPTPKICVGVHKMLNIFCKEQVLHGQYVLKRNEFTFGLKLCNLVAKICLFVFELHVYENRFLTKKNRKT